MPAERIFDPRDHFLRRAGAVLEQRVRFRTRHQRDIEPRAFRVLQESRVAQRRREGGAQRGGAIGRQIRRGEERPPDDFTRQKERQRRLVGRVGDEIAQARHGRHLRNGVEAGVEQEIDLPVAYPIRDEPP